MSVLFDSYPIFTTTLRNRFARSSMVNYLTAERTDHKIDFDQHLAGTRALDPAHAAHIKLLTMQWFFSVPS